jgi:hypothetical protein
VLGLSVVRPSARAAASKRSSAAKNVRDGIPADRSTSQAAFTLLDNQFGERPPGSKQVSQFLTPFRRNWTGGSGKGWDWQTQLARDQRLAHPTTMLNSVRWRYHALYANLHTGTFWQRYRGKRMQNAVLVNRHNCAIHSDSPCQSIINPIRLLPDEKPLETVYYFSVGLSIGDW